LIGRESFAVFIFASHQLKYLNFIETYLGLSPDGGDGSAEIFVLVALVGFAVMIGMTLPIGAKSKRPTDV
jgi:hypothetical protein